MALRVFIAGFCVLAWADLAVGQVITGTDTVQPGASVSDVSDPLESTRLGGQGLDGQDLGGEDSEAIEFFESHIRPALIQYCYECHSAETEASGGLLLDSRQGLQAGGDSGPALVEGHAQASRLLKAISYEDTKLQMPPDQQLPPAVVDKFSQWIDAGAMDPRSASASGPPKQTGLAVEQAGDHWAYRPVAAAAVDIELSAGAPHAIDRLIDRQLRDAQLETAPLANDSVLIRRLYFDLTGLPPTSAQLARALDHFSQQAGSGPANSSASQAYLNLVEELLSTPQYGEHFARKWLDVARFAESITLRGFVLPEAWRYRDYVISAFTQDRPFDVMIREQIAGDLLDADNLSERHRQLIATGFLAMGNTNLEEQDKAQLEMDYVDEQLEVIGRAFLGQTIGCARCHDHKFDPIPTRDYYALAGILRSATAMEHSNVSKWIEQPLPLSAELTSKFNELSARLETVEQEIGTLKKQNSQKLSKRNELIAIDRLPGVVVDNPQATLVGDWVESSFSGRIIGTQYIHDKDELKGQKTATFEPNSLAPGEYQVRLAYTAGTNRATNTQVRIFSAEGEATVIVDQTREPPEEGSWLTLGKFRFEQDGQAFVLISNDDSNGHVVVDAVQFLALGKRLPAIEPSATHSGDVLTDGQVKTSVPAVAKLPEQRLAELSAMKQSLSEQLPVRSMYLTVLENQHAQDIPIHIRGDVHNLGELAPRGFLTAIQLPAPERAGAPQAADRVALAQWLSSSQNPLTARVYANRVWAWLMGQGIVASIDNFGTTGALPSHPELLDYLARELVISGWSTKHLVRLIVQSQAYRRSIAGPDARHQQIDPANTLYWRGQSRRLSAEAIRDAMLSVSGELDLEFGGSSIPAETKADYNYRHQSTRRSIYQPVFRNALPELFEAFDFADTSVSTGQRARSTVATQGLVLLNHPWVTARAQAAAERLRGIYSEHSNPELIRQLFTDCYSRAPSEIELSLCLEFLQQPSQTGQEPLTVLVHTLLAAIDFRYLE